MLAIEAANLGQGMEWGRAPWGYGTLLTLLWWVMGPEQWMMEVVEGIWLACLAWHVQACPGHGHGQ